MNYKKKWYIIQSLSGIENKVAELIKKHIKIHNVQNMFGKIMIPTEEVIEIKNGKKKKVKINFFQDIY
ncbi:MAG: hypothetical protein BucCj_0330 [Buchnera aphidicola (Ceratovacuna japonica)]